MKTIGGRYLRSRKTHLTYFAASLCFALQLSANNVITDWTGIASMTIVTNGAKPSPAAQSGLPTPVWPPMMRSMPSPANISLFTTGSLETLMPL